jgi:hypothetical protein
MTLLNRASDGLASVLVSAVRAVREFGTVSRNDLIDLLTPGSLDDERVRHTLLRWQQLGLFVQSDNQYAMAPEFSALTYRYSEQPTLDDLRCATLDLVMRRGSKVDDSMVDDAVVGAWWMLTIDPFTDIIRSWEDAQRVLARDFPNQVLIQNDTRWAGLVEWAQLWGLIQVPALNAALIPCPAEAICWHLEALLPSSDAVPVKKFIVALNNLLPVIPALVDGPIENSLSKKLPQDSRPIDERSARLSHSLALALNSLSEMGHLKMENFDTGDKWFLTHTEAAPITHLVRK